VEEFPDKYPESGMFGQLPAYGLYCRHVKGLKMTDVVLQTSTPDARHAVVCDDVEDVTIEGLNATHSPGAAAVLRLVQTRGALIRGCRPQAAGGVFLKLEGNASRNIVLAANDLSGVARVAETAPEVPKEALIQTANH
jgi:hypothetical protein